MSPICANCGITIRWQPTIVDNKEYCCDGCAKGGPCTCDYDALLAAQLSMSRSVFRPAPSKAQEKRKE